MWVCTDLLLTSSINHPIVVAKTAQNDALHGRRGSRREPGRFPAGRGRESQGYNLAFISDLKSLISIYLLRVYRYQSIRPVKTRRGESSECGTPGDRACGSVRLCDHSATSAPLRVSVCRVWQCASSPSEASTPQRSQGASHSQCLARSTRWCIRATVRAA